MGMYLNPEGTSFKKGINSPIYVDKTELIAYTNKKINTQQCYLCVSRPRRFGKSMAADMLAAYYGSDGDAENLFQGLKIAEHSTFHEHLNKYNVIKLDMQKFMSRTKSVPQMLDLVEKKVILDFEQDYPDITFLDKSYLEDVLCDVFNETSKQFVILIDEWDCVMRRYHTQEEKKLYLDFLRNLMKDQPYIALAYMTGILPIKKYGEHSTLNMFDEYSMTYSSNINQYFGFTAQEVEALCEEYEMNLEEVREWYDGYHLLSYESRKRVEYSIYSPKSVNNAMLEGKCKAYWNSTETFGALKDYITINLDGLKDAVVRMLGGESVKINPYTFKNDMSEIHTKDDAMTLLVHLGYLAFDQDEETVRIPNKEVSMEFKNCIETGVEYQEVAKAVQASKVLLEALWEGDEERIARGVDEAHEEIAILKYNDENALSCTIGLAFYYAREYYNLIREMPSGKGFADIVCIPKPRYQDKPAIIIELKWDKEAETAIKQIKEKHYPASLKGYEENLILCGIIYDKEKKKHTCKVENLE